ncbi:MAG: carbohydrate binding domain-containing protein, partial [Armatimonadota bacterium]|nr:carbohydrate binding domain-containing protein [Armatimonadota bacterium]
WMNLVKNACFETGTLEGWTPTDAGRARITPGNGWGNSVGGSRETQLPTGTSKHELCLGGGVDGVMQQVTGLRPETPYTLSAWVRVSDEGERVCLGVRGHGAPEAVASTSSTTWTRLVLPFKTGPQATAALIFLRKSSDGPGQAWCDNVGLPKTP